MRWHLQPFLRHATAAESVVLDVYVDEDDDGRLIYKRNSVEAYRGSLSGVLHYALWDLHGLVPRWARDFLFVHAGSVTREGRALVLPAPASRGKSTLVTALLLAGFEYLSDEVAALDPVSGDAYAFPKRIALDQDALRFFPGLEARIQDREGSGVELPKRHIPPEDVGAAVGSPGPVRWIVFLSPDHEGRARLAPVGAAEAVERLAASCLNLYRYGERGVVLLSRVAQCADAYELAGGTPAARAELLADLVGA